MTNGCIGKDSVHVVINLTPTIPAISSNSPICAGSNLNLIANFTNLGVSYSWTGPNFSSSIYNPSVYNILLADSGLYTVAVTLGPCSSTASTHVTVKPMPPATTIVSNGPLCAGDTLYVSALDTSTSVVYSWAGPAAFGTTTQNFSINNVGVNNSGTYFLTVSLNGCNVLDSGHVVINSTPNMPSAGSNSPLCAGSSLFLTAYSSSAGVSYNWLGPNFSTSSQNPVRNNVLPADSGWYSVTANLGSCTAVSTTYVVIKPLPLNPSISSNSPLCENSTLNLSCGNSDSAATYNWKWPDGYISYLQTIITPNANVYDSGSYVLNVSLNGCNIYDTVNIIVKPLPPIPVITANTPVCANANLNFSTNNSPGTLYNWTGPNFSAAGNNIVIPNVVIIDSGGYEVSANLNGCFQSDSIHVVINPLPDSAAASCNNPVCEQSSLQLFANSTSAGTTYSWTGPGNFSSNAKNPQISNVQISNSGSYSVAITLNGCTDTLDVPVSVNPFHGPPVVSISSFPGDTVCIGTNISFTATANNAGSPAYQWMLNGAVIPGATNPTYSSSALSNGDHINCAINSNYVCQPIDSALSNSLILDIIFNPAPVINFTHNPQTYVLGDLVTFNGNILSSTLGLSYIWTKNGNIIPGFNTTIYTTNDVSPGDEICIIVYSSLKCTMPDSAIACTEEGANAVHNVNTTDDLKVWPNPFDESLNIQFLGSNITTSTKEVNLNIRIFDVMGSLVYGSLVKPMQQTNNYSVVSISTANFAPGTYLLELSYSDGERKIYKIVK